jgi:phosphoserine phosphatase
MSQSAAETFLIRVSGPDRPGILAGVLAHMVESGAELQDIEQITIRGNLDLNLVVSLSTDREVKSRDLLKELLMFGWENDVHVTFDVVPSNHTPLRPRVIVTVVARTVGPAQLAPGHGSHRQYWRKHRTYRSPVARTGAELRVVGERCR